MSKVLTRAAIKAAIAAGVPEGKSQIALWDAKPVGFGLKLRASGSASWVYVYRPRGSSQTTPPRTITLGSWPSLDLDDARRGALRLVGKVAEGGDPAADLRKQRLKVRSKLSIALDSYEHELARRKVVARKAAMSILRRGFAPIINEEVADIDQPMLIARIMAIATKPKRRKDGTPYTTPGAAGEFRKHAQAFLAWCVSTGLAKYNVLAGYRIPRQTREEMLSGLNVRHGKALDDAEIAKVWAATGGLGAFGALIQLGLLTGLRRNEIATLEWSDIRDDAIVIPARRSKMGRDHFVPLTSLMREIVQAQPRRTGNPLVFPSPVSGGVMSGWSRLLPRLIRASGVTFRLHDLRKTCRSLLSMLDVDEAVAELCIGHVRRGLIGVYNLDIMRDKRRIAFEKVSAHIAHLVGENDSDAIDAKVVALRPAG